MVLVDSKRPFVMIATILIAIFLSIIIYQQYQKFTEKKSVTIYTGAGPVKIQVEYAETPEKQRRGLMGRASFDKNSGMLFIFSDEKQRSFWMKNTLIPLEAIFISSKGIINEIAALVPCPPETSNCPVYKSTSPARFVLEVNAGFAERTKIVESDILEISGF